MDLSKPNTHANLEAAFGGESMANRKYLFFSEVAKQLGHKDLAKLFRDTPAQETEHAFAHFRLLHPELVVNDPEQLSDEKKQAILSRCLELAIEGETYEYTTMYPEFAAQARQDRGQRSSSGIRRAKQRIQGACGPVPHRRQELRPADTDRAASRRNLWRCPICGSRKASFVPYREAELKTA